MYLIYSKRQIRKFMFALFPRLLKEDRRKLARQLDDLKNNKALEAVWELAILYALNSNLKAEFHILSSATKAKPDALVDLGLDKKVLLEVTAPSGDTFSFKSRLDAIVREIFDYCESVEGGSGSRLRLHFGEWRTNNPLTPREPSVAKDAISNKDLQKQLRDFLASGVKEAKLAVSGVINARIVRRDYVIHRLDYFCSIPSDPQSDVNNLTYNLIEKVGRQLIPFKEKYYTGLIVCDGGNSVISSPRKISPQQVDGRDLMGRVLNESGIDFIAFVGRRDVPGGGMIISPSNTRPVVSFTMMSSNALAEETTKKIYDGLSKAILTLPPPLIHPYQAKSMLEQVANRGRNWPDYNPTDYTVKTTTTGREMKVRISSSALRDLIFGRIDPEDFRRQCDIERIRAGLPQAIVGAEFETRGEGHDDDYVVLELENDPDFQKFADYEKLIPRS